MKCKRVVSLFTACLVFISALTLSSYNVFAIDVGESFKFEVEDLEIAAVYDNKSFSYVDASWGVSGKCPQISGDENDSLFMAFKLDIPEKGYYKLTYAGRHHETGRMTEFSFGNDLGVSADNLSINTDSDVFAGKVDASVFGAVSNRIAVTESTDDGKASSAPTIFYLESGEQYLKIKVVETGSKSNSAEWRLNCDYVTLTKMGEETVEPVKLNVTTNDDNMGDAVGSGTYEIGDNVTVTAVPKDNCRFKEWTDKFGNVLSDKETFEFKITKESSLIAVFTDRYFRASEDYVEKSGSKEFYTQKDDSANLGDFSRFKGTEIGDYAIYSINVHEAGEYQLTYRYRQHESTAIVRHYVNDVNVAEDKDHYYQGNANSFTEYNLGVVNLKKGKNEIKFEIVGKNSNINGSSAELYQVNILDFNILPKSELPIKKELSRVVKVACIGDSITNGSGSSNASKTYPAQLQQILGDSYDVQNFGVGGRTLLKKGNYPYWNESKFQESKSFDPDIVIIMLGTNDAKPQNYLTYPTEFEPDYKDLIDVYKNLSSSPKVYVATSPYAPQSNFAISSDLITNTIVPLQWKIAADNECDVIDIYSATYGKDSFFGDGIHPTDKGYALLAQTFYNGVKDYLPNGVNVLGEDETLAYKSVYLPDVENVEGLAGTEFEIPVIVKGIGSGEYRSIEGVIEVPTGMSIVDLEDAGTISGGSLSKGVLQDGKYRFAYINHAGNSTLSMTNPSDAETLLKIKVKLDENKTAGSEEVLKIESFTAKKAVISNDTTAPNTYISVPFDVTKASSKITISESTGGEVTAAAKVLYQGDGSDLIDSNKKAVSVVFTGVNANSDISFGGKQMYYSPQRSARTNQIVYVAIVDSSVSLSDMNIAGNYTINNTTAKEVVFGNTNNDSVINAQDALNVLDTWLRKNTVTDDKQILEMNVTCDDRIDTSDALAVADYFVNGREFEVTVK